MLYARRCGHTASLRSSRSDARDKRLLEQRHDAFRLAHQLLPTDPDDEDPQRGELEVTPCIGLAVLGSVVPSAVELDDEPNASEVAIDSTVRSVDAEGHLALGLLDPL